MAYRREKDLHFDFDARRGFMHFLLYMEPPGSVGSGMNATHAVKDSTSPYFREWRERLERCDANALHVVLAGPNDARRLWDPCVHEDPDSRSAIAGDGCVCRLPFRDPKTSMAVVAEHFRTITGNIEEWEYRTHTPLALPDSERLYSLIIDRDSRTFWLRTDEGVLHLLPEAVGAGYEVGYSGGGPAELADFIEKLVLSDGYEISAGTDHITYNENVRCWTRSGAADLTQEISLDQLKALSATGQID